MITKARVKELLQLNLRDERASAIAFFINNLVQRKVHGSGIEQYRIKNTLTGTWVTSLDEFIDTIDADNLFLSYPYEGERLQSDKVTGFLVTIDHFEVVWDINSKSDKEFASFFDLSSQKLFQFLLIYVNDGDTVVPLKTSYVKLVNS
jgi:hypothetical protein